MFKVTRAGENRLDIVMSGRLDTEAMKTALDELLEKSDGIENGTMLYDVVDYHLPSLNAIMIEFERLPEMLHFIKSFSRAAVLTDKQWLKLVSEFESVFLPWLEIKGFPRDGRKEAEAWLSAEDD